MYSKNAVGVIDRDKRTMIATWSIAEEGRRNAPMAFDEADHRLFVVARDPGRVIVLDTDSGKIITSLPGGSMLSDDAFFDPILKRLYVTGIPFLSVFQKHEGDSYQMLGQVPTAFHALQAILVSQLSRYYLSVPHHGKVEAQVQVYETVP